MVILKTILNLTNLVDRHVDICVSTKARTVHCNFSLFISPCETNCVFTLIFVISLLDSRGLYST
jgi:hypothetical protein